MQDDVPKSGKADGIAQVQSFIEKLLSLFSGGDDPEAEKKRLLKNIAKELGRSRYKFIKPKGDEVLPSLAKFFYEIYKVIGAAQVLLANAEQAGSLKSYVIASCLTKDQLLVEDRLHEESIKERAKTVPLNNLQEQVTQDLTKFFSIFDTDTANKADEEYSAILLFMRFIHFDYYFLLKKFDAAISERNFNYHPKFEAIQAEYISDDLKDFLEVFYSLNLDADWRSIFTALKGYKGLDVVNVEAWIKLCGILKDIKSSAVLENMVRLLDKDPYYVTKPFISNEHIVEQYLQKMKTQADVIVQKLMQEKRNSKVDELCKIVFGTTVVVRTKNYADRMNVIFAKKMLGGFIHVQPMNYLKAFLIDFFKKDIRELIDLFLIRGQWSTNLNSQMLSESFHALMQISDAIVSFDDSLADEGDLGVRLKNTMLKADRDKDQVKYLRTMLKDINDKAQGMINQGASNLISMGKTLKALLDDYDKTPHELIINWKEVEAGSEEPIKTRITNIYKKIYYFVSLLQFFARAEPQ